MKNTISLLLFSLLLIITGCSKDDDTTITTDPCDGIECFNGQCINGVCDCISGYEGPSCATPIIPSSVRINNINVNRFPALKPNNGSWDPSDGADLAVFITYNGSSLFESGQVTNANANTIHTFTPTNLNLTNTTDTYRVELWDVDALFYDEIGFISFAPYVGGRGFPPSLTFANNNNTIEVRIDLSYSW